MTAAVEKKQRQKEEGTECACGSFPESHRDFARQWMRREMPAENHVILFFYIYAVVVTENEKQEADYESFGRSGTSTGIYLF